MKATLLSLVFAAGAFAQSAFTINTPTNAVVCEPLLITWSGGTPPYTLVGFFSCVLPGGQPSAPSLEDLGQQNGTSFTWNVNEAAGTSLGLTLRDSNGNIAQTAPFTVNPGGSTTCVGQPPSGSGGSAAPPQTGGAPPAATPATGGAAPAPTTNKPTGAASGSSTSPSSTSTSNAASANFAGVGAAGIVGAAIAALFA